MEKDEFPSISASPTLLLVADVEETVLFLQKGFGFRITGSWGRGPAAGEAGFGMLESGSVRVVVGPKLAGLEGVEPQGCASLTLATDRVRGLASAAVKAGARLIGGHQVPLPAKQNASHTSATPPTEVSAATGRSTKPLADQYVNQSAEQSADHSADQSAIQSAKPSRSPSISLTNGFSVAGSTAGAEAKRREQPGGKDQQQGENEAGLAWLEGPAGLLRVMLIDSRLLAQSPNAPGSFDRSDNSRDTRRSSGDGDSNNSGRATTAADLKTETMVHSNETIASDFVTQNGRPTRQCQSGHEGSGCTDGRAEVGAGLIESEGGDEVAAAAGATASCDGNGDSSRALAPSGGIALPSPPPPLLLAGLASWARSARRRNTCSSTSCSPSPPSSFPAFASPSSSAASSCRSFYSAVSMELEGSQLCSRDAERSKGYVTLTNGSDWMVLAQRTCDNGGGGSRGSGDGSGTGGGAMERRDGFMCGGISDKELSGESGAIERRDGLACSGFSDENLWGEGDRRGAGPDVSSGGRESPRGGRGGVDAAERMFPPSRTAVAAAAAATESVAVAVAAETTATVASTKATVVPPSAAATVAVAAAAATEGTASSAITGTSIALPSVPEAATDRGELAGATEAQNGSETAGRERRPDGRRGGRGLTENGVADGGGEGGRQSAARGKRERPCRELELFQLGNLDGPLKIVPNSSLPIPINNGYFEGSALLMVKREPMAPRYAHMFEGKNRMFEIQVQGRFKRPPEGDLYISLEITDRMKLGLLAKGLCKLLLSFCQRMTSRLHYSFGDKDNKELPHIAFPLVASVDSLICTAEGGEVPVLGNPFQESKESKDRRKRGEGDTAGFGTFETGCTYSFSFHSMYLDMPNWSTCKVPVMRDMDLHTFWGGSALRIAAYVIKPSSSAVGGGGTAVSSSAALHLQSELDYVFCIQVRHLTQEEQDNASPAGDEEDCEELEEEAEAVLVAGVGRGEEEGEGAGVGDEITLPLLTDREPSPRAREMSSSRWMSNDDASDGEMEQRRARRSRRRQEDATRKGTKHSVPGRDTALSAPSSYDNTNRLPPPTLDKAGGRSGDKDNENVNTNGNDDEDYNDIDDEDEDDDDDDDDDDEDNSDAPFRAGGLYDSHNNGDGNNNSGRMLSGDSEYRPFRGAVRAAGAAGAAGSAGAGGAVGSGRTGGGEGGIGVSIIGGNTGVSPPSLGRRNSGMAASSFPPVKGAETSSPRNEALSTGAKGTERGSHARWRSWAGEGGSSGRDVGLGVAWSGEGGVGDEVEEDEMVRCPAYVDLYARSAKPKGTWTVYCIVQRGKKGTFSLRSNKNVSILPMATIGGDLEFSPRLSRKEVKRRTLDSVLKQLTTPSREQVNRSHQVLVRAVLGMESSADRAYRSYSPAPATPHANPASPEGVNTAGRAGANSSGGGGDGARGERGSSSRGGGAGSGGGSWDGGPGSAFSNVANVAKGEEGEKDKQAGRFLVGVSIEQAVSVSPEGMDEGPPDSPPLSEEGSGKGSRGGSLRRPSRRWTGRSLVPVKEGMVLRVLSEHHLSQQVALLLPSSLTFSRPRKQCLRLLMRDILGVETKGTGEGGARDTATQLIPGMYLVEIHTVGRVHYMLVEGLGAARSWATAIQRCAGQDGRTSPQDEVSISDPFSQYMTKKSTWKASNFWVLNCRRSELSPDPAGEGWGDGCWLEGGGVGNEVCDFVAGLLRQALELNDDSKPEQLISFLDNVCKLRCGGHPSRWMPLEGLSQAEQLSVFLNLYHVMLLHAFFLLGPPGSPLRVASYFTTLSYEVGGEVFSMADLEHCVLRAKTSQPKQFLSKLIIPTAEYPFSLRKPEPRVSFALNCGSTSGVPGVSIYRPEEVDRQLDDAAMYYVSTTTQVLFGRRTVVLPRIVSWYSDDFNCTDNGSSGSSIGCLRYINRYLAGEKREQVDRLLSDGGQVTVKFDTWNWKCRPVALVDESEMAKLRSTRPST